MDHFTLTYNPEPSGRFTGGYWNAHSTILGVGGDGETPEAALAALVVAAEEEVGPYGD